MSATAATMPAKRAPVEVDPAIARAYDACREIARRRARNFYYGLKLTPEPRRSAIYSIYAWMREGDDEADAPVQLDVRRASLRAFRERTERVLAGERAGDDRDPMWTAFAHTIRTFHVDPGAIRDMVDGLEEDLDHQGYEAEAELDRYCRRVASSVGRVCVGIWGVRDGASMDEALRLADLRGRAFQLTNILRDFAEDFDTDRVYLPLDAFRSAGLTPRALRDWSDAPACEAFVRERVAMAKALYDESAPLEGMVDAACAPTLWAMTRIYAGLLAKIEREPRRVAAGPRIRLQSIHKAGIAMRAVMRSRGDGW